MQKQRFRELEMKVASLVKGYPDQTKKYVRELKRIERHFELAWAILQHYEVTHTPYLDMTASLRVAASFATLNSASGYVYLFALPYPTGTITYAVDNDIKIVRLQAACPPSAKRPYFQEGYLVGSCYINPSDIRANQNASRRLLTKFYVPDASSFWTKGKYDPIPKEALYPDKDNDFSWV